MRPPSRTPSTVANEAEYLGFGDGATTTVYFYIDSDDLGTQVTAKTTVTAGANNVVNVGGGSYQYKSGDDFVDPSKVNSALHYTGGANQPLTGTAKLTVGGTRNLPNAITDATGGEITSLLDVSTTTSVEVEFTFNIIDMYAASAGDADDPPAYVSGYGRAYVSSGSDSGQWVAITEVAERLAMALAIHLPLTCSGAWW